MDGRYIVAYTVPVYVIVEISADGEEVDVEQVVVGDESTALDEGFGTGGVVFADSWAHVGDLGLAQRVREAADDSEWPSWGFGF